MRGIARPLGKQGVRINAVAPEIFCLPDLSGQKMEEDKQTVQSMLTSEAALGCLGTPADVASLVAYLASPCCSFATGGI